jgi:cytochrome c peroxidase
MKLPVALFAILMSSAALADDAPRKRLEIPALPAATLRYSVPLPPHLSVLEKANAPGSSPVTDAGATLGRVLFFDRRLSANGLVSCGSCHTPANGFDDPTRLSIGFQGRVTRRSAMTLTNARFNPRGRFFRDERAASLEDQVLDPFTDPIEMGLKPGELVRKVAGQAFYPPLFAAAFGDQAISEARIADALSQYVRAIVSTASRYDEGRAAGFSPLDPFPGFSTAENRGKRLFFTSRSEGGAGCSSCHQGDAFVMIEPENNGLDAAAGLGDDGVGEITGRPADIGRFRAASLKNIAVTPPYMHDGRFKTLAQVIAHYSDHVWGHPNLSPKLRHATGSPARLNLSRDGKLALEAFLGTLTDATLNSDQRFADPFIGPASTQQ